MSEEPTKTVSRRQFVWFVVTAPTLTMAARLILDPAGSSDASAEGVALPEPADRYDHTDLIMNAVRPFAYDLLIEVTPDNRVRFEVPRAELGQGVLTAAAMMLADHLDARLQDIDATPSPAEVRRRTGQLTGGSLSVRSLWDPIGVLGGHLRARLATAGAEFLGVPASAVRTEDTHVVATDGRRVPYGTLAEAAARVKVPAVAPTPKPLNQMTVIGTPQCRLDARRIVTGQVQYAMDVPVAGALPTVIALPATVGVRPLAVDDSAARAAPGVVAVTSVPGLDHVGVPPGVAVTAHTFGQALAARRTLRLRWSGGPMEHMSDAEISGTMRSLLDPVAAPADADGVDAQFEWPFLAHAPMETNDAVADVRPDRAELWMGTQAPVWDVQLLAEVLDLDVDRITLHVVQAGGGFGSRGWPDPLIHAAQVSRAIGRPVKMMWSRQDDLQHSHLRPASLHHVRATVAGGQVQTYEHRVAAPQLDFRHGLGEALTGAGGEHFPSGYSQTVFHLSQRLPYAFGATSFSLREEPLAVPTGSWRSIFSGTVATVDEIVVDELARFLGRDEYEFRRGSLDTDRSRAVLDTVAHHGRWGKPMPLGTAQGIGIHQEYKSVVAYLVECDARRHGARITRATVAVDAGRVVNPTGLEAQLLGCLMDGVAAVLHTGLHIQRGAVREAGLADYRLARMFDSPLDFNVIFLPATSDAPGGGGELGLPAACAAIANAWARATGRKPRRFPLNEHAPSPSSQP